MKRFFLYILSLFIACSPKKEVSKLKINQTKHQQQNKIDKKLLNGVWAENEDENALFAIRGDSLFYVEDLENPCLIKIKSDTLIWTLKDGYIIKDKILKLTKDSLILYNTEFGDTLKLYNRGPY